jgi:hypothetical protein
MAKVVPQESGSGNVGTWALDGETNERLGQGGNRSAKGRAVGCQDAGELNAGTSGVEALKDAMIQQHAKRTLEEHHACQREEFVD